MFYVGVFGDPDYIQKSKVIKTMASLHDKFKSNVTILSGGATGPDEVIKKYALHFGMTYVEYNPSWTGRKLYSAEKDSYYGKAYHISQEFDRYKKLIKKAEKVIIFGNYNNRPALKYAHGLLQKFKKAHVVIN